MPYECSSGWFDPPCFSDAFPRKNVLERILQERIKLINKHLIVEHFSLHYFFFTFSVYSKHYTVYSFKFAFFSRLCCNYIQLPIQWSYLLRIRGCNLSYFRCVYQVDLGPEPYLNTYQLHHQPYSYNKAQVCLVLKNTYFWN